MSDEEALLEMLEERWYARYGFKRTASNAGSAAIAMIRTAPRRRRKR